jgi:ornithine lipid ester-linked acyl 2-hydroxylase
MGKPFRDYAYDAAMLALKPMEYAILRSSLVGNTAFLPMEQFPWARKLEDHWTEIRAELDSVLRYRDALPAFHEISADVSDISDEKWKIFAFYGYGFRSDANCARCPTTARLLAEVPGLTTAFFSILAPGKRIPPHRGPWKGVLRYHLGLLIPDPERCGIKVGGETAHWREGESLVFDDAYEHSAWNDTESTRVVLFIDVLRPCRFPGSWINRFVIKVVSLTPFLQDAKRKHKAWERKVAATLPG